MRCAPLGPHIKIYGECSARELKWSEVVPNTGIILSVWRGLEMMFRIILEKSQLGISIFEKNPTFSENRYLAF